MKKSNLTRRQFMYRAAASADLSDRALHRRGAGDRSTGDARAAAAAHDPLDLDAAGADLARLADRDREPAARADQPPRGFPGGDREPHAAAIR